MAKKKADPELPGTSAWPFERRCPECGRVFCVPMTETWSFWDRDTMLCSWGCVRKREKAKAEKEAQRIEKSRRLTPKQKEGLVRRMLFRGLTNEEIGEQIGLKPQLVNYYRKKVEEESWKDD